MRVEGSIPFARSNNFFRKSVFAQLCSIWFMVGRAAGEHALRRQNLQVLSSRATSVPTAKGHSQPCDSSTWYQRNAIHSASSSPAEAFARDLLHFVCELRGPMQAADGARVFVPMAEPGMGPGLRMCD